MFDRDFWNSKLGKTSLGCVTAMVMLVAISSQAQLGPPLQQTSDSGESLIGIVLMTELA